MENLVSAKFIMSTIRSRILPCMLSILLLANYAWPWGNEGHMMINRVAAEKLPSDVPAFLRNAEEQLAYLGPEPDRWREKSELALKLSQEPDHFIDLELVEGMTLPPDRYSYYRALEARRNQIPTQADRLQPDKVGLQPYITMEIFGRLVVAFREYRHAVRDHTNPEFAERNAIVYAGWLGHYVADGSNPLHTTVNYNGWTTANPHGYTTEKTIHWKMEGVFVAANQKQLAFAALVPDKARKLNNPFQDYVAYIYGNRTNTSRRYISWRKREVLRPPAHRSRGSSSSSAWLTAPKCCAISGTRRGSTAQSIRRQMCHRSRRVRHLQT